MDTVEVAAALLSALLHAAWNAGVKASRAPVETMTAQMVLSAAIVLPGLFWSGLPQPAAWPWIAASTLMNVLTVTALLRAYALGGFGMVYPMMRALAVLLVVPLAATLAGERIGGAALLGVGVIVAALAALAVDAARDRTIPPAALGWTIAAGIGTAAYILCDARGVRAAGSPLAYAIVVSTANALAMCWRRRLAGPLWAPLRRAWRPAWPIACGSAVSYLLILWVWSRAPIAPAAALRDTSAVFALLIAIYWLKEPFTPARIAAVLLATAAVPLLRLG